MTRIVPRLRQLAPILRGRCWTCVATRMGGVAGSRGKGLLLAALGRGTSKQAPGACDSLAAAQGEKGGIAGRHRKDRREALPRD